MHNKVKEAVAWRRINTDYDKGGPAVTGLDNADTMQSQDEVDELLSSLGF